VIFIPNKFNKKSSSILNIQRIGPVTELYEKRTIMAAGSVRLCTGLLFKNLIQFRFSSFLKWHFVG